MSASAYFLSFLKEAPTVAVSTGAYKKAYLRHQDNFWCSERCAEITSITVYVDYYAF